MKYYLAFIVAVMLIGGCNTSNPSGQGEVDPRPPLMNTNSFVNFHPYTNDLVDPDLTVEQSVK